MKAEYLNESSSDESSSDTPNKHPPVDRALFKQAMLGDLPSNGKHE